MTHAACGHGPGRAGPADTNGIRLSSESLSPYAGLRVPPLFWRDALARRLTSLQHVFRKRESVSGRGRPLQPNSDIYSVTTMIVCVLSCLALQAESTMHGRRIRIARQIIETNKFRQSGISSFVFTGPTTSRIGIARPFPHCGRSRATAAALRLLPRVHVTYHSQTTET
jgi:hypothetical protein